MTVTDLLLIAAATSGGWIIAALIYDYIFRYFDYKHQKRVYEELVIKTQKEIKKAENELITLHRNVGLAESGSFKTIH